VTGVAFERLDVGVYSRSHVNSISSTNPIAGPISNVRGLKSRKHLRVSICLSRCSSLVNDCPQYVQKTMVNPRGAQWVVKGRCRKELIQEGLNASNEREDDKM
jgi:hypothetical protein